jgi:3-deoxy-D-manno-octulosonic-acid transferase
MANCAAMAAALDDAGAALAVADADGITAAVSRLLADPAERKARARAAAQVAAAGSGAVEAVLARFAPWLDALVPRSVPPAASARSEAAPVPTPRRRAAGGADAHP